MNLDSELGSSVGAAAFAVERTTDIDNGGRTGCGCWVLAGAVTGMVEGVVTLIGVDGAELLVPKNGRADAESDMCGCTTAVIGNGVIVDVGVG